jgi:hypothetical protein
VYRVAGYRRFGVTDPRPPDEQYGIILFDPPFFNAAPATQLAAVRMLAVGDGAQPLLVWWLVRRQSPLLEAVAAFGLGPTGYRPGYLSVPNEGKNVIEF